MVWALLLCAQILFANVGQSSVAVLNFPWGARSTGLGETFTGIADTEEALFYNPAGLGQAPLANAWVHYDQHDFGYTKIHGVGSQLWSVNEHGEILSFVGSSWNRYHTHFVDDGEELEDVVERYLDVSGSDLRERAKDMVIAKNNLRDELRDELHAVLVEAGVDGNDVDSLVEVLVQLPAREQNETAVFAELAYYLADDDLHTPGEIVELLRAPLDIRGRFSLRIPYNIGPSGRVYDILAQENDVLWVATDDGLWRFSAGWTQYGSLDGVPSETVYSLNQGESGEIYIATKAGPARYIDGDFSRIGTGEEEHLLSQPVYAIARDAEGVWYFALEESLLEYYDDEDYTYIGTEQGLYDSRVTALFIDSRDRLWVGTRGGVVRFDEEGRRRFNLGENTVVKSFGEEDSHTHWVATDRGASQIVEEEQESGSPEYVITIFHERNSLHSSHITDVVIAQNGDIWLSTDSGIERYQRGQMRASLFFENLLPSLGIDDMWHAAAAVVYPIGDWGSVGFFWNQLYFGEIETGGVSGTGQAGSQESAFEFETGLSYGFPVTSDFSLGLNLKYAYSRLERDRAEATTVAVDAGLLRRNLFIDNLDLGFVLKNMGPPVTYSESEAADPIPFLARLGLSYAPIDRPGSRLVVAVDANREIVYRDEDGGYNFIQAIYYDLLRRDDEKSYMDKFREIIWHGGVEYTYADFISFRSGILYDDAGSRSELSIGIGAELNNILADISIIVSTLGDDNQVRENQTRFSVTYIP